MKRSNHQRGQALVLIVLALVGMIALTALAVDGGNVYSDRRRAQNAADSAALAAGLARIRQDASAPWDAFKTAGWNVAATNGYQNTVPDPKKVVVVLCSESGANCPLPAKVNEGSGSVTLVDTDPSQFIKVTITSKVQTYFAPIVGIRELTNQVDSIVRAIPGQQTEYFNGSPLAAVMPHCKYPGWPADPFVVGGSANITVSGAPMFDNSDCEPDFINNLSTSGGSLDSKEGIWLRGTATSLDNIVLYPAPNDVKQHYGPYIDPNSYSQPQLDDECSALSKNPPIVHNADGSYTAAPGRYTGSFPALGGGQTIYLLRGLYCLYGGLAINGGLLTTDLPGGTPGVYDANEGVLFYLPTADFDIKGNATVNIHAITTNTCPQSGENGLLIYLPNSNSNSVSIAGGSGSAYTGSIIAPASLVSITGNSGSASDPLTLETQIIGYSISIGGSGGININFNKCLTATTFMPPQLQPFK